MLFRSEKRRGPAQQRPGPGPTQIQRGIRFVLLGPRHRNTNRRGAPPAATPGAAIKPATRSPQISNRTAERHTQHTLGALRSLVVRSLEVGTSSSSSAAAGGVGRFPGCALVHATEGPLQQPPLPRLLPIPPRRGGRLNRTPPPPPAQPTHTPHLLNNKHTPELTPNDDTPLLPSFRL